MVQFLKKYVNSQRQKLKSGTVLVSPQTRTVSSKKTFTVLVWGLFTEANIFQILVLGPAKTTPKIQIFISLSFAQKNKIQSSGNCDEKGGRKAPADSDEEEEKRGRRKREKGIKGSKKRRKKASCLNGSKNKSKAKKIYIKTIPRKEEKDWSRKWWKRGL